MLDVMYFLQIILNLIKVCLYFIEHVMYILMVGS